MWNSIFVGSVPLAPVAEDPAMLLFGSEDSAAAALVVPRSASDLVISRESASTEDSGPDGQNETGEAAAAIPWCAISASRAAFQAEATSTALYMDALDSSGLSGSTNFFAVWKGGPDIDGKDDEADAFAGELVLGTRTQFGVVLSRTRSGTGIGAPRRCKWQ
eukprot:g19577.t1